MNNLVRLTFGFAIVLIVISLASYFAVSADDRSFTALLPAIVGVLLLGAGFAASNPSTGRYGGMAAAALVVLLMLGSLRGVFLFIGAITGGDEITLAMIVQIVIVLLGAGYLFLVAQHMRERSRTA